jgi:putative hydrolase of HD superfamily
MEKSKSGGKKSGRAASSSEKDADFAHGMHADICDCTGSSCSDCESGVHGKGMRTGSAASSDVRLVDFLHEAGMLKRTPRSGWATVLAPPESVADHSFRTAVVGLVLAKMEKLSAAEEAALLKACLLHDMEEARVSDLNLMNKKYVHADTAHAMRDMLEGLPKELADELRAAFSHSGRIAILEKDADLLDLILQAREYLDGGNRYAADWIERSAKDLKSESAKKLLIAILSRDSKDWMFATGLFDKKNRER